MTYKDIQQDLIQRYRINASDHCPLGCRTRMHAHIKERMVCKWEPKNSVQATFDLFHEVGHIETTTSKMRRCEEEFFATQWAIDRFNEYGLEIPDTIKTRYQKYINRELNKGLKRGGKGYPSNLDLKWEGSD